MYAIVYVLPFAFRATTKRYQSKDEVEERMIDAITTLCDNLSKCIVDCMFGPKIGISEETDWDWYKSDNKLIDLLRNAEKFEESVVKLNNLNKERYEDLDKPNLHRLRVNCSHILLLAMEMSSI